MKKSTSERTLFPNLTNKYTADRWLYQIQIAPERRLLRRAWPVWSPPWRYPVRQFICVLYASISSKHRMSAWALFGCSEAAKATRRPSTDLRTDDAFFPVWIPNSSPGMSEAIACPHDHASPGAPHLPFGGAARWRGPLTSLPVPFATAYSAAQIWPPWLISGIRSASVDRHVD